MLSFVFPIAHWPDKSGGIEACEFGKDRVARDEPEG